MPALVGEGRGCETVMEHAHSNRAAAKKILVVLIFLTPAELFEYSSADAIARLH